MTIDQIVEPLAVWRNPVFQRFRRSRLRLRKAVFWYLLTLIVTTFVVALAYIIRTNSGTSGEVAARGLWIPLLVIQGLILMVKGTGATSAGLIQDKIDQTLDYQRLTPLVPIRNLLGYLFGLPVLEYVMLALTLPHLVFIVIVGEIPLGTVFSVYLAFFLCAVLYHMTGIAAGMVMRKWIWGYWLAVLLVIFVNVILPAFISQLGLRFLQYLSVWPVIGQKVLPLVLSSGALTRITPQNPFFSGIDGVPFYNWTLSPFTFTLLLQGALIATFTVMALRRWKSSTRHSLSKPYALAVLCGFIVLVLGNVWPAITGRYMPFALFGRSNLEQLRDVLAIGLPLVYCFVTWLLCFVLFAIVLPSHHAYVRGIRRALKLERKAARAWADDSASIPFVGLFVLAAIAGFAILFREMSASGFLDFLERSGFSYWRLPVAFALVLLYTALMLLVLEIRPTVLVVLLLWWLPILATIVSSAATESFTSWQAVMASVSPLALVFMSGMVPAGFVSAGEVGPDFAVMLTGVHTGLVFVVLQIAWLWARWAKLKRSYYDACRARTPPMIVRGESAAA